MIRTFILPIAQFQNLQRLVRNLISECQNLANKKSQARSDIRNVTVKVSRLTDDDMTLKDEIFSLKAELNVARGEIARVSAKQDVLRAAMPEHHPEILQPADEKCFFSVKRRNDTIIETSAVGAKTEDMFRKALSVSNKETILAKKTPGDFFRFLMKEFYKSPCRIVGMKLPPMAGASKDAVEKYKNKVGKFMDEDVCAAAILLGVEYFPNHLPNKCATRIKLRDCINNFTKSHKKSH